MSNRRNDSDHYLHMVVAQQWHFVLCAALWHEDYRLPFTINPFHRLLHHLLLTIITQLHHQSRNHYQQPPKRHHHQVLLLHLKRTEKCSTFQAGGRLQNQCQNILPSLIILHMLSYHLLIVSAAATMERYVKG